MLEEVAVREEGEGKAVTEAKHILLSDHHGHSVVLTEQEIGIALHALDVLSMLFIAFSGFMVITNYSKKIEDLRIKLARQLNRKAVKIKES